MPKTVKRDTPILPPEYSTPNKSKKGETARKVEKFIKSYSIERSPNHKGKIRFNITPTTKKLGGIYALWKDKRFYIGKAEPSKSGNSFGDRLVKHRSDLYLFRTRDDIRKKIKGRDLYADLNAHPEKFTLSVRPLNPDENIEQLECDYIQQFDAVRSGYNRNRGGGGGKALQNEPVEFEPPKQTLTTPEKWYPIQNGQAKITPRGAKAKRIVYRFKNKETEENYVGSTIQSLSERTSAHLSASQDPNHRAYDNPFKEALRNGQNDFEVGILYKAPEKTGLTYLRQAEAHHIQKVGKKHSLLNCNQGTTL